MAVPGAVARRTEREAQELREAGIDPTSGAPIAAQVLDAVPTPSVPASPQVEDSDVLRTRVAELEAALRTQNGRASTSADEVKELMSQLNVVNANRSFLEGKLTELTEEVTNLRTKTTELEQQKTNDGVAAVASTLDETGPTEAQMKEFGADSVDFIERIVKRTMAGVIKPLVAKLSTMETQLVRVREIDSKLPKLENAANVSLLSEARNKEREFFQKEVLAHYPDFETVVRGTPEWQKYLLEDVQGRGYKVGEMLKTHRDSANAVGIRTIIGAFYDRKKEQPSLESLAVPGKTGGDAPLKPESAKVKASEYNLKLKQFTFKKIDKPTWEAFRTRFDQALAAGNVEMDEEIR